MLVLQKMSTFVGQIFTLTGWGVQTHRKSNNETTSV